MLSKRLLVASLMVPTGMFVAWAGGWVLAITSAIALGIAGWEFWNMFRRTGSAPSLAVLVGGIPLIVLARWWFDINGSAMVFTALIFLSTIIFILQYEKENDQAAIGLYLTLGGLAGIGWLGSYAISLRQLQPDGVWWTLLVYPAAAFADVGGYVVGKHFGKHPMTRRVSPKKTWEGYAGGIVFAALGTALLAALWHIKSPSITWLSGLVLGSIMGVLLPCGDLGMSLVKRQTGVKDSSNLLPGHGGVLDRIDTWLWAGAIGFYLVAWTLLPIG